MTTGKTFRILSLDGGGVRGIITARWLARLEEKLGSPARDHFDLIAGTSTGSILAAAIGSGIPAKKIVDLYRDRSSNIFPKRSGWNIFGKTWDLARNVARDGVSYPKYRPDGLHNELKEVFRNRRKNLLTLGSLKVRTIITSYNTLSRSAMIFKSWKSEHKNLKIWEVCTASASAPTFFPAHIMKIDGVRMPLIDGGVVANNPTACAIAESIRLRPKSDLDGNIIVVSMGTGEVTRPISIEESQEWGALEWAVPIIDVLFDGAADSVHYIAEHLVGENNYHRLQVKLTSAYDEMDNADATNINALMLQAESYLDDQGGEEQLDLIASKIQTTKPKRTARKTKKKARSAAASG